MQSSAEIDFRRRVSSGMLPELMSALAISHQLTLDKRAQVFVVAENAVLAERPSVLPGLLGVIDQEEADWSGRAGVAGLGGFPTGSGNLKLILGTCGELRPFQVHTLMRGSATSSGRPMVSAIEGSQKGNITWVHVDWL
jgi:hypothetical protein